MVLRHITNGLPIFCSFFTVSSSAFSYDDITLNSDIVDDLGADSLDLVDLVMSIEDEFEIEVPDEAIEEIKTVDDAVKYIEDHE